MNWKKLTAIWSVIVTIWGGMIYLGTIAYDTYGMVVDIHAQYATKDELADTYLKTRVDDYLEEKKALEALISFYETKRDIEPSGLTETDRRRLATHKANLEKLEADFKESIEELTS